jgi:DNA-binding transcriptional LysR family regulator
MVGRLTHSPPLERFRQRYPQLHVEFVMSDRYIDLREGRADVALRSGDTDDGDLVGRKIGDSVWAAYASATYIQRHGKPASTDEIVQHPVVAFDDSMTNHRASVWLQRAPGARVAARHGSVLSVLYAVKIGVGIAALPTVIADAEPTLQRVLGPIPELTRVWRILTLPQLRRVPRVAAFFDHMVDEIDALRPIITG